MQVIAFISGKGGVGKTTLVSNIGAALAQRKKRVLLVDLDPQNALRLHLGMAPDEIAGLAREGISSAGVFDSPFGMQFIPFGQISIAELEEFEKELTAQPEWLSNGLASLSRHAFDFILLDTPPGASVFLQQVLVAAHRAMVVLMPDAASLVTVPKILSLIENYTAERSTFAGASLLINQMPDQNALGHQVRSSLYAQYPALVVPVSIHKDARVAQALAFERPLLEYQPGAKASLDVHYVADWLIDSTLR
jgi:cellulose synthase operon protein YhjQ